MSNHDPLEKYIDNAVLRGYAHMLLANVTEWKRDNYYAREDIKTRNQEICTNLDALVALGIPVSEIEGMTSKEEE
jgi:hypothetical protein